MPNPLLRLLRYWGFMRHLIRGWRLRNIPLMILLWRIRDRLLDHNNIIINTLEHFIISIIVDSSLQVMKLIATATTVIMTLSISISRSLLRKILLILLLSHSSLELLEALLVVVIGQARGRGSLSRAKQHLPCRYPLYPRIRVCPLLANHLVPVHPSSNLVNSTFACLVHRRCLLLLRHHHHQRSHLLPLCLVFRTIHHRLLECKAGRRDSVETRMRRWRKAVVWRRLDSHL